ncbi:MAG: NBR1-Ig-like domain-containing protein [Chloroflexota bacterium]
MPDNTENVESFFLFNPVDGEFHITSRFNTPRDYSPNGRHEGVDLRVKTRTGQMRNILAAQRGTVDRIRHKTTGLGIYVKIDHEWPDGNQYSTWYGHMSKVNPNLKVGQFVQAGDVIGVGGSTGNSTGPHLHLTLQHHGHGLSGYVMRDIVNPTNLIRLNASHASFDQMAFVEDITAPDGMMIEAGKAFVKKWRVKNVGSTTWGEGYKMIHVDGDTMGARLDSFPIPAAKPGEEVTISIPMKVPNRSGVVQSVWQPMNPRGQLFLFQMYAEVVALRRMPRDEMRFVADVSIPDGTDIVAGETFLKTWRIKNSGTSMWKDYTLEYIGDAFGNDSQMGAPSAISVPFARPDQTVDLSVTLTGPASPGTYRSTWRLRKKDGGLFGQQLFAEIKVSEKIVPAGVNGLSYIDDVTVQDNTELVPQQKIQKIWRIRNSGTTEWGDGYTISHISGKRMGAPKQLPLTKAKPGEIVHVIIDMETPDEPGDGFGEWRARDPEGRLFGDNLTILVKVADLTGKDNYRFLTDVTIPDNTIMQAGQTLRKVWRVRNTGLTSWGNGYTLRHVDSENLADGDSFPLPNAQPGQTVDIGIDITSPVTPGLHKTSWRPFNSQNQPFGFEMFALIRTPAPVVTGRRSEARLKEHTTIPNGTKVTVGETFTKQWTINNTGDSTWGSGFTLAFVDGDQMDAPKSVAVRRTSPGQAALVGVPMTAPSVPGEYTGRWRMRDAEGKLFGSPFQVRIIAEAVGTAVDLLPFMKGDGRLYEMKHFFHNGQGQQRVQTQVQGNKFFHVKNHEWEELWSDDSFIYRGTDTSPGSGNFYRLSENGKHGSKWIPRHMTVGQEFRRKPLVTLQRKDNCQKIDRGSGFHETWIRLDKVLDELVLPDVQNRHGRGIRVKDVMVLTGMHADGDRPGDAFERYYYAKKYGLVMWEGLDTGHNGRSFMVEEHKPGDRPNNVREALRCGPF